MQIDWDELIGVARDFHAVYRAAENFHHWQDEIWAERYERIGNECAGPLTDADIDAALDQADFEERARRTVAAEKARLAEEMQAATIAALAKQRDDLRRSGEQ